ncbi:hypothetical protein CPC08DRAFT_701617 [Agrocybe pediades]|nr:hypothetical protein CPC08DRAFT_701617 [Agrocybe pediades]
MEADASAARVSDIQSQKQSSSSPPPYRRSPSPSMLLTETRTTRTEVVTTTTTQTTTHTFSLPYWRKRNTTKFPTSPATHSPDATSSTSAMSPVPTLLIDKALPPTPPSDNYDDPNPSAPTVPFDSSPGIPPRPRRQSSAGPHSAVALAHAALGIGLPHASTSFSPSEANKAPFFTTSSQYLTSRPSSASSPRPATSPGLRRAKSNHRVQARHVSEAHEHEHLDSSKESKIVERRRRGLSFGATSFLNISNTADEKGKTKSQQSPSLSEALKSPSKPLARKSSFWNRKKSTQVVEASKDVIPGVDNAIVLLPPLPPVLNVSPFNISAFPDCPAPPSGNVIAKSAHLLSRSHSEGFHLSDSTTNAMSETNAPYSTPALSTSFPQGHPATNKSPSNGEVVSISHRPRRQASTPLLHRLSMGVFSSAEPSPSTSLPADQSTLGFRSPSNLVSSQKTEALIPKPLFGEEESPEVYLARLKAAVSKAEVAGILASSPDPFYAAALRSYITQFDFCDVPLDIALRKLLMEVGLPRETQQIDRVMEAFAARYMQCNPENFTTEDHAYILAFSLIMLHTDAFNPSNRRKMTKADYIKNTKLPGIPVEVLDCYFDNIVFAPFIFIEDPVDFNGQLGLLPDIARSAMVSTPTSAVSLNAPAAFRISNKIDPYYLIINNLLGHLKVDVTPYFSIENPYSYQGTNGPWDEDELHRAFLDAHVLEIDVPGTGIKTPLFNSPVKSPSFDNREHGGSGPVAGRSSQTWNLKITKIGVLNRKDDFLPGGRRSSNRKWKAWSVILSGSQLLFFRDVGWAGALSNPSDTSLETAPPSSFFRPDESFSVKDAIAVYDHSYTKYKHTLRFILPDGRQILLQADGDKSLNEWISRINYASAFKTAGVRIRPPGLSGEDVQLTGVAAATSHLHDIQKRSNTLHQRSWDSSAPSVLMDMLSGPPSGRPATTRRVTMAGEIPDFNADVPVAPEVDGAEQFKATFDRVKADLAASSWTSLEDSAVVTSEPIQMADKDVVESPLGSAHSSSSTTNARLPTRSQIIQAKIRDLEDRTTATQSQLDSDLRLIRNLSILTPFQKSTRARLSAAVQITAKRVNQLRLEMEKLRCHMDVLRADLASEDRSWNDSKETALRVAKETLQSRYPKTTIFLDGVGLPSSPEDSTHLPRTPTSPRPDSSPGSFHSALESGFEWPSSDDIAFLTSNHESPKRGSTSSFASVSAGPKHRSLSSLSSDSHHLPFEQEITEPSSLRAEGDDLAEDWNKTRGAKRVSLIHVPADIRISSRFQKPSDSQN